MKKIDELGIYQHGILLMDHKQISVEYDNITN